MIHVLTETKTDDGINQLIATCKSDSRVTGAALRQAHYRLGQELAATYKADFHDPVAVCFMRGGLPFSMGVADTLDCTMLFLEDKACPDFFKENQAELRGKQVLLIDSVVNSGNGMLKAIESLKDISSQVIVMTNVLCHKATDKFKAMETYAVRISKNSFKGSDVKVQNGDKGPDTGDRLFRTGINA